MKNLLDLVKILVLAAVMILPANFCSANYYDDSPDYVYVNWEPSVKTYLDLRSVDVQEYNPPHYQISGVFVDVQTRPDSVKEFVFTVRYNWYTKETYIRNEFGNWEKENIKGQGHSNEYCRSMDDALFRAAYKMDFYGY